MKVYAQKQNQPQQQVSSALPRSSAQSLAAGPIANSIMNLQRTIGDQAVQGMLHANAEGLDAGSDTVATTRFAHDFSRIPVHSKAPVKLQAKLNVNTPGDIHEQEADRVAEQVTSMPEPQVQRACACGGGCPSCQNEQADYQHLQTKPIQAQGAEQIAAPPIVDEVLRSSGQPLNRTTQGFMESRFGHDFSNVRVHTDARAGESARAVNALAYTKGHDVVFDSGRYAPDSKNGQQLLAHELSHVLQQRSAPLVQRQPSGDDKTEREKIEAALKSKDSNDVKAIKDVNQATEKEKIQLIQILVNQFWVGPYDEWKIEELWSSFGDELPRMMTSARALWDRCIAAGAELDALKLRALKTLETGKAEHGETIEARPRKSLGEVGSSFAKLKHESHDIKVLETGSGIYEGKRCTAVSPGAIRTDCTDFVIEVLHDTFAQQGRAADWKKVEKKYLHNIEARGAADLSGLDIQAALQSEAGWKGIYWAPDPAYLVPRQELAGYDPITGKGIRSDEASSTSQTAKRQGTYYKNFGKKGYPGVSVAQTVTNYAPEMPIEEYRQPGYPGASTTKKDTTQLDKLKKLPFGVLSAHGGHHMMILTYGKVIEVHWDAAVTSARVIQQTDLEKWAVGSESGYHFFASGVIVAPAGDVDAAFK